MAPQRHYPRVRELTPRQGAYSLTPELFPDNRFDKVRLE